MIDETVKSLAKGKNFAAFTSLFSDGRPQTQMMWVDADDEHILINTEIHRAKFKNTQRDSRVTVTIVDAANPYHYAEVRGRVTGTVHGQAALDHINEVSRKYTGAAYANPIQSERVILTISPEQIHIN